MMIEVYRGKDLGGYEVDAFRRIAERLPNSEYVLTRENVRHEESRTIIEETRVWNVNGATLVYDNQSFVPKPSEDKELGNDNRWARASVTLTGNDATIERLGRMIEKEVRRAGTSRKFSMVKG